jgi:hypothetical protein
MSAGIRYWTTTKLSRRVHRKLNFVKHLFLFYRKQAWLWSLGDAYRIKDRPRYMSSLGMNSAIETIGHNPLRYSIGDNNNNEVCFIFDLIFVLF